MLVAQGHVTGHPLGFIKVAEVVKTATHIVVRYDESRPDVLPRRIRWRDLRRCGCDPPCPFHLVGVRRQRLPYRFERRDLNAMAVPASH